MKLLRYGEAGAEKPGMLDQQGAIRDLSGYVTDISAATMVPAEIARLKAIDPASLPRVAGTPRLAIPVAGIRKCIGIGRNYAAPGQDTAALPEEPFVFSKAISCLNAPNDPVILPANSRKSDWEAELGVIIGRTARAIEVSDALNYVAGYCVVNDLTEREWQLERGLTWDKGKGFDTFGPTGPWMVTADEVGDPQALNIWLDLNGERMQTGNTRAMIFTVAQIVSYVSRCITLWPGDLICTGTPPGVGLNRKPLPMYLKPGDVIRLGIDGLGEQQQMVVDSEPST